MNIDISKLVTAADKVATARIAKTTQIKAERDKRKVGGVLVGTLWYHSDDTSRIQWLGLKDQARDVLATGLPMTTRLQKLGQDISWKTLSGAFEFVTCQLAFDVVAAMGVLDAMAFGKCEDHIGLMEVSIDPAAYDFSLGWPDTFVAKP